MLGKDKFRLSGLIIEFRHFIPMEIFFFFTTSTLIKFLESFDTLIYSISILFLLCTRIRNGVRIKDNDR